MKHPTTLLGDGVNDSEGLSSPGADTSTSSRSHALSTKLTTALSTSYADPEIRIGLALLDAKGARNDAETRRDLKLDAQAQVIQCNAQIIQDFGNVAKQFRKVGDLLATLGKTCDDIRKHVHLAKQETTPVLEEAAVLLSSKQETESKQETLDAFNKHFIISDEDLTILRSSAEPIDDRFFAIFTRVKQIHKDCEVLLGCENQRLGTELMEQTSRHLDAAFKKLYSWIQREFKGLDLEDPHINGSIRKALRVLSERPTLFQNCLDFFADARQHTLAQAFQVALTDATASSAKAIEFSTHDPLRYIGDMLAWVHSTTVSEKEALEGLFIADEGEIARGIKLGQRSEPWSRISSNTGPEPDEEDATDNEQGFDGHKALSDLISRNLGPLCQTLRSRIELSIRNIGEPVLIYKVINLLNFYDTIFNNQIGPSTVLTTTLSGLSASATAHFQEVVADETNTLMSDAGPPPPHLTPPSFLPNLLHQLVTISQTRTPQLTSQEFENLFSTLLSHALNTCAETASTIQDTSRRDIFKLNYLCAVQSALATIVASQVDAARPSVYRVEQEIDKVTTSLSDTVQMAMLAESGVGPLLEGIHERRELTSHDQQQAWLVDNLDSFAQRLDAWLPFALMNLQDGLKDVIVVESGSGGGAAGLRRNIVRAAVEEFCAEFDELEQLLDEIAVAVPTDSTHKNPNSDLAEEGDGEAAASIRDLYPRTGTEVRALLS